MKTIYKVSLFVIALLLVGSIYLAQSYALWTYQTVGEENIIEVGVYDIGYSELNTPITLNNTYPISDAKALGVNGVTPFTFTIANNGTVNTSYKVTLNTFTTNTLDNSNIKFAIVEGSNAVSNGILLSTFAADANNINTDTTNFNLTNLDKSIIIASGDLAGGVKSEVGNITPGESVTYKLYVWIDNAATNDVMGKTFSAKVAIINNAKN